MYYMYDYTHLKHAITHSRNVKLSFQTIFLDKLDAATDLKVSVTQNSFPL